MRTILDTAVADEVITANPCRLRGAGQSRRVKDIRPASLSELNELAIAMPERLRLIVLIAAWRGLRFGELVELRRKDVDAKEGVVRVVAIPPHLVPVVAERPAAVRRQGSGRLAVHRR